MKKLRVLIRTATFRDLPAIFRLASHPSLKAPNHPSADRGWIRSFIQHKQIVLVAQHDAKIVGFALGESITDRVALLHLFIVDPAHRRQGIGTQLIRTFEAECRRRKLACILSYAAESRSHMQKLLKQRHYTPGALVREYQKFL